MGVEWTDVEVGSGCTAAHQLGSGTNAALAAGEKVIGLSWMWMGKEPALSCTEIMAA